MQFLKGDIQEGILKAAEEVFLEKGYKDASMREIASRAGVTVSNIYHYFTNKDEIFRTILKPVLNDLYASAVNDALAAKLSAIPAVVRVRIL